MRDVATLFEILFGANIKWTSTRRRAGWILARSKRAGPLRHLERGAPIESHFEQSARAVFASAMAYLSWAFKRTVPYQVPLWRTAWDGSGSCVMLGPLSSMSSWPRLSTAFRLTKRTLPVFLSAYASARSRYARCGMAQPRKFTLALKDCLARFT